MIEGLSEVLHEKVVVFVSDPPVPELGRWLVAGVDSYLGPGLADDQRSLASQKVQFDFPDVGVGRSADPTEGKGSHAAIGHFQCDGGKVIDIVVDIGLVKVSGGPGKDAFDG